uniref:Uncharacterized protein n=1 Tax=Dictyoglomus turgidum TaxID=513050 RepID=A0A7C3SN43_9BACT
MKAYWGNVTEVLKYFGFIGGQTPLPVHIKDISYDSANGSYVVTYVNAGVCYPSSPSRTKSGTSDDSEPTSSTDGTPLTEFNQARFFILGKTATNQEVTDLKCDITLWFRERPDSSLGQTQPGPWIKANTIVGAVGKKEYLTTLLHHREIYLQLTGISGTDLATIEVYVAGANDLEPPVELNLGGISIENANLSVEVEAIPSAGEKADSVILASTLDGSLPTPSNLAPPVKAIGVDSNGRLMIAGGIGDGDLNKQIFPVVVGGRYNYNVGYAYYQTNFTGDNNDLIFSAVQPGPEGNEISITIQQGSSLSISVSGKDITITGNISGGVTAKQIRDLVYTDVRVTSLIRCEFASGNDGTGNVGTLSKTYLSGGSGESRVLPFAVDDLGALHVYNTNVLNYINDSVSSYDVPPPEIVCGGNQTTSTTIGNCVQLTTTSYLLRRGVWVRVDPNSAGNYWVGIHYTYSADSIWDHNNNKWVAGRLFSRDGGEIFIPINDPSKLWIASNTASVVVIWQGA